MKTFMKGRTLLTLFVAAVVAVASARGAEPPEFENSLGMKFRRIEAGEFVMGQDGPQSDYDLLKHPAKFDDADWDERPAHRVKISTPFYLGVTEVTVGQYRRWFDPNQIKDPVRDDEAARNVSWGDAVAFCQWLSAEENKQYRLPTEAEWEYACRAGTTTLFHTGDALPAGFNRWYGEIGLRERYFPDKQLPPEYAVTDGKPDLRVGRTPPNAWGLFDMHGNIAEWCADWYGPYEPGAQRDPVGRGIGEFRVIRGGSHNTFTRMLRSANRSGWIPDATNERTGFRVVLGERPTTVPWLSAKPPLHARDVAQTVPQIELLPADRPVFVGPKPFVIIPPGWLGPLFSAHNHSPAIAECPNGDLLAVWYSCVNEPGSELCNVAGRLRRGAAEWEPASPFWDGPDVNDHAPKLWWDGERTLFHLARGLTENILRTSADNGVTWSRARRMQPHGEFGNQMIRTREGHLVITQDNRSTSFNISRDGGKTWTYPGAETGGKARQRFPGIHAPIVQLADGRLMTISRLNTPEEQKPFDFLTPASFTADWGETWTHEKLPFPAISSVQRAVLMRLREGPLLLVSFTDQRANWKERKGLTFKSADGGEFTGYGMFAALSFDEGKTWPTRRLVTAGGSKQMLPSIDRSMFEMSDTMAESGGYLAACQTRDGNVQLITSKNHYVFNLAWLQEPPPKPER